MPETWVNYWYYGKDGKLIKAERLPRNDIVFVVSREFPIDCQKHDNFCPIMEVKTFPSAYS